MKANDERRANLLWASDMLGRAFDFVFVDQTCPGCNGGSDKICERGHLGLGTLDACRILIAAGALVDAELSFSQELKNVRQAAVEFAGAGRSEVGS